MVETNGSSSHQLSQAEIDSCEETVNDEAYLARVRALAEERGIPPHAIARVILSMRRNANKPHRWRDPSSMKGV